MTQFLVIDVEGPIDGNAFNPNDRLSMVGLFGGIDYHAFDIEHTSSPYGPAVRTIQSLIEEADVLIAFNSKYDLHWLRRYGIKFSHKKLWCLQYAEWCLSGQQGWPRIYPDLDTACQRRGLRGKSTEIWDRYWSKGIPTMDIPWGELRAYNMVDLQIEWALFQDQRERLLDKAQLKKLIWYGSQDLLVTEEMEWNGLHYDIQKSIGIGNTLLREIGEIEKQLSALVSFPVLWSSPAQLSAVLYGGTIKEEYEEEYEFTYKDGHVATKHRKGIREYTLERLIDPLKNTKNTNGWSTDEGVLKKLKPTGKAKQIISLLLRKRELDKKVGTYYHGIPKLTQEKKWENSLIHGQLSHCRAATGRLSSKEPNQQNIDYGVRECLTSRFPLTIPSVVSVTENHANVLLQREGTNSM